MVFVLLGFAAVAVPAYAAFNWIANSTIIQLGTLFAEKQVLYDRHRGLGALMREVALAEALAGSQAIRDWTLDEDNPAVMRRGIAELEHYRQSFADNSYFFVIDSSGNYYFNDAANSYAGSQRRYAVDAENPRDAWYFHTKALAQGCHLNVDNDANLGVTKVWINCVIREGDRVLGVLGSGIDLSAFIHEVVNIPQAGVTSMFVDRQGQLQAHRDQNLINLASLSAETRDARSVFSLLDDETDRERLRALMEEVASGQSMVRSIFVDIDGHQTLVGVGYLDRIGWFNVTLMDVDTIIDRRLFMPIAALLIGVMGLVAFLLMVIFKHTVLDRLSRLERAVRGAQNGNFGPALSFGDGAQDEVGRLGTAFVELARTVHDNTRLLETRVSERTQELQQLAFMDVQTGVLNRRGFAAAHAECAPKGQYGVLLMDIDRFKTINDNFGHAAGDQVVIEVARRIGRAIDRIDTCARWGGDEYIVLLPGASPQSLRATAEAVLAGIRDLTVVLPDGREIRTSVSIGACLSDKGDRLEMAADMADAALYMAKSQGRNQLMVLDREMQKQSRRA
nr:diguanylate cyclase [Devosia faecipullorum]